MSVKSGRGWLWYQITTLSIHLCVALLNIGDSRSLSLEILYIGWTATYISGYLDQSICSTTDLKKLELLRSACILNKCMCSG